MSACTGGEPDDGSFRYKAATPKGHVIPEQDRKPSGNIRNKLMDGSQFSLDSRLGTVVFISFWGAWCGPCVAEVPMFESLYQQHRAAGVEFLGIVVKDDEDNAQAFIDAHGISYPNIFDYEARSALQIGRIAPRGFPYSVVIDKHGRVAGVYVGAMLAADLDPVLTALSAEG